ncbi:Alpha-D-phosphohexomutase, alpha/beta/alpha domain protein II domain protein, partial [mine drainage metagenome]
MLSALGAQVVSLNCNADGRFTSRESEPKPENLTSLLGLVKSGHFDLGIAHDGDADRTV